MQAITKSFPVPVILFLIISPAIARHVSGYGQTEGTAVIRSIVVSLLVFVIPFVFFYKNLKVYFCLLLPLVFVTPLLLFTTTIFAIRPGFELIAFILQTNPREVQEAASPYLIYFIPFEILFMAFYIFSIYRMPSPRIPFRSAGAISLVAFLLTGAITFHVNGLYRKSLTDITKHDVVLKYDYPMMLAYGMHEARVFLKKNNLRRAEDFSFRAVKKDVLKQRQVYVLIIGESSRYDRWQINGYGRPTSPRLAAREDLLSFRDVVSGAHYTWASVPQIITRATPENYDLQYQEKSILGAFGEAGFKTVWLSNQSDQDIFWSGSITLHAKTADVSMFSPTYSPNLEFESVYDARLLPLLDSLLLADDKNLFLVMHTMGNHWEYSQRYPPQFDRFRPSGYNQSINPPDAKNREAILNSYDNSILYADFLIDSVINTVKARAEISMVAFISDHGEDLFDVRPDQIDFHFRPSAATLKVPLFVWTSESYKKVYPEKRKTLEENISRKIGTENIFYTVLDIANIRVTGFDSTKSIAHPSFIPSLQKFFGDDKKARLYSQVQVTAAK